MLNERRMKMKKNFLSIAFIAILSPLFCYLANWWIGKETGYKFGYELLMLNGTLTFAGLMCMSKKEKTLKVP